MGILSYAQNFEDVLLNRVFGGQNYGFYVDIGAYKPIDDSVTKAFYDRGWSGLNVEPGDVFQELAAARPRDINLNMAVYDRLGEIAFVQHPGWYAGLSHVARDRDSLPSGPVSQPEASLRHVKCDTLTNILATYASRRPIAFLKIDAEGAEAVIIASTDWRAIRPTVLLVEATLPLSNQLDIEDWEPLLLDQGYIRAYFDGLNCFYVPEERHDLLQHFAIPVNTLDGFVRYDPAAVECQRQLQAAESLVAATASEKAAIANELAKLTTELADLTAINSSLYERQAAETELLRSHGRSLDELRNHYDWRIAAAESDHAAQLAAVAREHEAQLMASAREHDARLADLQADHSRALAGFYQELTSERDRNSQATAALRAECDTVRARLAEAAQKQAFLLTQASRLHRLVRELDWPDGPRALRSVLPLARLIRHLSGKKVPEVLPEEVVIRAMDTLSPGVAVTAVQVVPPVSPTEPSPLAQRRKYWLARRLARVAYAPIRPVVRSIAWRTRTFLTAGLHSEMVRTADEIRSGRACWMVMTEQVLERLDAVRLRALEVPQDVSVSNQISELAGMLNSTLLTLALGGGSFEPGLSIASEPTSQLAVAASPTAPSSFDFNTTLHNARGAMLREMPPGAQRLLSAGCAGRWYFDWIEQCYGTVPEHVGIEFYSPVPDSLPPNVTWIANTASDMEAIGDATCDLVFSGQNMEHLWSHEVAGFLIEAARVLKAGGHVVVDSPNRDITAALNWSHPEHTIELSVSEVHRLLELAGFDVTKKAGIWLCRDPATGRLLPLTPDGADTNWSAAERLIAARDHPEDSFVWWLEGRRNGQSPDRDAIEALLDETYRFAWPERIGRMTVPPGRQIVHRDGDEWVVVSSGETGVVLYGPYVPLRAGRHLITFTIDPDAGAAGVLGRCEICIGSDAAVLQQQDITPDTHTVTFTVELDTMEFGGQFRCISAGGGFAVRRLVSLHEELS